MSGINIEKVDHIGVRVRDLDRSLAFYEVLGFKLAIRVTFDPVAIIHNARRRDQPYSQRQCRRCGNEHLMDLARNTQATPTPRSGSRQSMTRWRLSRLRISRSHRARRNSVTTAESRFSCAIRTAMLSNCADGTRATYGRDPVLNVN